MSSSSSSSPALPLVSVVIPANDAARYLEEALESVRVQTYRRFEIIVVDDGSTDETARIARGSSGVRYFYQERAGAGPARNQGVERALGEFVTFLDADDLWPSLKLAQQVAAWNSLPQVAAPTLIFGHAQQFFSSDLTPESRATVRLPSSPQPAPVPGTLFTTPEGYRSAGPQASMLGENLDWYLRARDSGARIHILPEVHLLRRIHNANVGRNQTDERSQYARILKASLDRRRQASE